jgi:hypothetical protein
MKWGRQIQVRVVIFFVRWRNAFEDLIYRAHLFLARGLRSWYCSRSTTQGGNWRRPWTLQTPNMRLIYLFCGPKWTDQCNKSSATTEASEKYYPFSAKLVRYPNSSGRAVSIYVRVAIRTGAAHYCTTVAQWLKDQVVRFLVYQMLPTHDARHSSRQCQSDN